MRHDKKHKIKILLSIAIAVILGVGVLVFMITTHHTKPTTPSTDTLPTAQSSFTGNEIKQQPAKTPDDKVSATDNNGLSTGTVPPSSKWTTSRDGSSIVVYSPSSNSVFASGDTVYGTAKSSTVSYDLEDSVSGVIAQGTANVVNGKFSIEFTFSTTAPSGKIDIFNQDSKGIVSNNVTVPVSF